MDSTERVIASFVVDLAPLERRTLGRTVWKSLHALLFHLVDQADPALARVLHATNQVKPFTVSNRTAAVLCAIRRLRPKCLPSWGECSSKSQPFSKK